MRHLRIIFISIAIIMILQSISSAGYYDDITEEQTNRVRSLGDLASKKNENIMSEADVKVFCAECRYLVGVIRESANSNQETIEICELATGKINQFQKHPYSIYATIMMIKVMDLFKAYAESYSDKQFEKRSTVLSDKIDNHALHWAQVVDWSVVRQLDPLKKTTNKNDKMNK
mgnify:CR=1 FL=1